MERKEKRVERAWSDLCETWLESRAQGPFIKWGAVLHITHTVTRVSSLSLSLSLSFSLSLFAFSHWLFSLSLWLCVLRLQKGSRRKQMLPMLPLAAALVITRKNKKARGTRAHRTGELLRPRERNWKRVKDRERKNQSRTRGSKKREEI